MNEINKTGVYKIINKINNHIYIGSAAVSFNTRWRTHKNALNANRHENKHIQNAWNKYGPDNFKFEIILECSPEVCIINEQIYLDQYFDYGKNCYNMSPTAGNTFGKKHSKETINKLSIKAKERTVHAMTGKKHTDETKNKISIANTGKTRTKEEKQSRSQRMIGKSNHFYGQTHTNQVRDIISKVHTGKVPWNKGILRTAEEKIKMSKSQLIAAENRRGSRNGNSKYTEEQIIEVKYLIKNGLKNKDISIKTGISVSMIEKIKANIIWKHVVL